MKPFNQKCWLWPSRQNEPGTVLERGDAVPVPGKAAAPTPPEPGGGSAPLSPGNGPKVCMDFSAEKSGSGLSHPEEENPPWPLGSFSAPKKFLLAKGLQERQRRLPCSVRICPWLFLAFKKNYIYI